MPAPDNSQSIIASWAPPLARTLGVVTLVLLVSGAASAQQLRFSDTIQLGAGVLPAVGLQAGYLDVGDIFTREATVYGHLRPRFRSDEEELQVSAGIGVGLRIVGGLETLTLIYPRIWDVHVGMRFGPSLAFRRNETEAEQNRRFSLFLDPYIRFTITPRGRQTYFLEAGVQKPAIRAGVWLRI